MTSQTGQRIVTMQYCPISQEIRDNEKQNEIWLVNKKITSEK